MQGCIFRAGQRGHCAGVYLGRDRGGCAGVYLGGDRGGIVQGCI